MTDDAIDRREYGRLEAEVEHLKRTVDALQSDVRAMRDMMEQGKGGWKTLALIGGAAATVGAAATSFIHWAGGVRQKIVTLNPADWIIVDVPRWDVEKARLWFTEHNGEPYDLRGAFVCFLPFWWSTRNQWFCNQAVAAPFMDSPEIFTPSQFASIVVS